MKPVQGLSADEREDAIEYACYAKDAYDLTKPNGIEEAVGDYRAAGPRGASLRGLLRNFGEFYGAPSPSKAFDITTGSVCALT